MSAARIAPGSGQATVATGLPILDLVLTALAEGGGFDLWLEIPPGDPGAEVDAAGAAVGAALDALVPQGAIADGTAPADEALALVAFERSGRALVASNADLTGVGGLASDLPARFLAALAEALGLTLHVRLVEGEDTDHVLRAIFRALGRALAQAATRD